MRKVLTLSILLLFVFCTVTAYATPVGNIAVPDMVKKGLVTKGGHNQFSIMVTPEVDLTYDRNMKDQAKDTEYSFYGSRAGVVFNNKAYIYGLFGAADAQHKYKISGEQVEWDTETGFAWGAGATLIIYEKEITFRDKGILRIGIDGRYRNSNLDIDKVTVGTDSTTSYDSSDSALTAKKFEFEEWQAALGISFQFDRLSPYVGVKYSDATGKVKATVSGTEYSYDPDPKSNIGFFGGLDILFSEYFSVNVEARVLDEKAFSGGSTIRF